MSSMGLSLHGNGKVSKEQIRKIKKPIIEKKRRERINDSLNQLKSLVLRATNKDESLYTRMEKADILEMAVAYLQSIHDDSNQLKQAQQQQQQQQTQQILKQNSFQLQPLTPQFCLSKNYFPEQSNAFNVIDSRSSEVLHGNSYNTPSPSTSPSSVHPLHSPQSSVSDKCNGGLFQNTEKTSNCLSDVDSNLSSCSNFDNKSNNILNIDRDSCYYSYDSNSSNNNNYHFQGKSINNNFDSNKNISTNINKPGGHNSSNTSQLEKFPLNNVQIGSSESLKRKRDHLQTFETLSNNNKKKNKLNHHKENNFPDNYNHNYSLTKICQNVQNSCGVLNIDDHLNSNYVNQNFETCSPLRHLGLSGCITSTPINPFESKISNRNYQLLKPSLISLENQENDLKMKDFSDTTEKFVWRPF